jgi:hypothetical protein
MNNLSSLVDFEVPEPVAYGDVASTPEEQRDIKNYRDKNGRPQPHVDSENPMDHVFLVYPAPVLVDTISATYRQEAKKTYGSWPVKNVLSGSMNRANRPKVDDGI